MGSNYPTSLDDATNLPAISPNDTENQAGKEHDVQHSTLNTAVIAIQTKLGANASSDRQSVDLALRSLLGRVTPDIDVLTYGLLPQSLGVADRGKLARVITTGRLYVWDGTSWGDNSDGIPILNGLWHTIGPGLVLDTATNIVRVAQSGDVQITTASLYIGTAASSTATLTASGGTAPLTWTVSPALPSGLTMSTGGVITNDGTAATGAYTRTYTVTDANNQQVSKSISMTVSASDPYWSNVVALLHFDGTDGSTTFTDQKGHTFTAAGNAQIDTAQSKFGGSSGLFDGNGDYLTTPDSGDWDFGTGDFTVELWARFNVHTSTTTLVGNYGGASVGWSFQRRSDTNTLRLANGNTALVDVAWVPTDNTWYHIAVCRAGSSLRAFVDGVQVGATASDSTNITGSSANLAVGALYSDGYIQNFNGWMDELRITKGVARYMANFTPPTAPFPSS